MEVHGLTQQQVEEKRAAGLGHTLPLRRTKTVRQIIRDNVFTLFNGINFILAILVASTGSFKNLLFLGVIICNILIGLFQEIRSKRVLDRISLLVEAKVNVLRDGIWQQISVHELVQEDVFELSAGQQIPVDCVVLSGFGEVNEALITGESDAVDKREDSFLYSGSFIISGKLIVKAVQVGEETYAAKLSREAQRFMKHPSQLRDTLNTLLKFIGALIIPVGLLMFGKEYFLLGSSWQQSILQMSASMIGMIPEGLFFLTSISLAVGVINLASQKTLVQELYCIESLARVDVLCLDKTGTITSGSMQVDDVEILDSQFDVPYLVANCLRALQDHNFTSQALHRYFGERDGLQAINFLPFSSERKYSAVQFEDKIVTIGSYEHSVQHVDAYVKALCEEKAKMGYRVLAVCVNQLESTSASSPTFSCPLSAEGEHLKNNRAIALITIVDEVRKEAKNVFHYFKQQGVQIKIISGDDPQTIQKIAVQAGVEKADCCVDASTCTEQELLDATETTTIFGRVTPEQKKALILKLKQDGHTVAMTGDGVNDVLAFKEADCSIAMESGCGMAKDTADLVLLKNDFDALPAVVNEGRRVINNIQRSATLFLTKTLYSVLLALLLLILPMHYPFMPIQLSYISVFTIGIPSFFLAIEPNHNRVEQHFLFNVLKIALPAALGVIGCFLMAFFFPQWFAVEESLTLFCLISLVVNGILVLLQVARPFNWFKCCLVVFCVLGLAVGYIGFKGLLGLPTVSISVTLFFLFSNLVIQLVISGLTRKCLGFVLKLD